MTTNMSKEVIGSYKYTVAQKNLTDFNVNAIYEALCKVGVIR